MVALVDDDDYERVSQFKWYAHRGWNTYYAARRLSKEEGEKCVLLHRIIMNVDDDRQVDHRDGNGLDCRRHNLRVCFRRQNARNRDKQYNNTSGFKGVFRNHRRWMAKIGHHGSQVYVGTFDTPEEAARAYDARARQLHGEFALLNFPEP